MDLSFDNDANLIQRFHSSTVKPVSNDHVYDEIYYLLLIQ